MANTFEIPLVNSLRFFQQTDLTGILTRADIDLGGFKPYNNRPFDEDFFLRNLKDWQDSVDYIQPYQLEDIVPIYIGYGNAIADYTLYILDHYGKIYKTIPHTSFTTVTTGGITAFYYRLAMNDLGSGVYFAQVKYNNPGEDIYYISEPFNVQKYHEETVLLEYQNSYNDQNVLFEQSGITFRLRVHGAITEVTPKAKVETYEDQPLNQTLLSGVPYREYKLVIGGNGKQIPDYMADKINRALCCDSFKVEGHSYTVMDKGSLEPSRTKNYPLSEWSITLRDSSNIDSLEIDYGATFDYVLFDNFVHGERFWIYGLVPTAGSPTLSTLIFNREFFSGKAACTYMTDWIKRFWDFDGYCTINSANQLIFRPANQAESAEIIANAVQGQGFLPNWLSVTFDTATLPTLDYPYTLPNAVNWGDGTTKGFASTVSSKTYANIGNVTAYYYFISHTDIQPSTDTLVIEELGGEIFRDLEEFYIDGEKLRVLRNDMFLNHDGSLNFFDLHNNELNVESVNKSIIMILDGVLTGRVASSGTLKLDGQTPSTPPSSGSMETVTTLLKQKWTTITD